MKDNKIIGGLLLVLAVVTIVGMIVNSDDFWAVYNRTVIVFSVVGGIVLLWGKRGK
ncbi:MAG: hypothetical protein PHW62_05325 [Candidatus Ratteibacteria bacterium]|nr:hypothetical protein [Candidatus Ratteibacteria bacterium]